MDWFPRDASWWRKPDTTRLKKVHLMHPDRKAIHGQNTALCSGRIVLVESMPVDDPSEWRQCERCRNMQK